MATPFQYTPLDKSKSEIRLLWLPQSTVQSNPILGCSLIHTSLDNVPDFVALSYCWGGQSPDRPVAIDGSHVYVTESLETALLNLLSGERGLFLWVDAICINQQDDLEKTSQVQVMRHIYRAAVQVLIWLGPSTEETDCAIQDISFLGKLLIDIGVLELVAEKRRELLPWLTQPSDGSKAAAIRHRLLTFMDWYRKAACEDGEDPLWWLSSELANRQWFRRIWCIQECVNARVATLRCGDAEVDYTQAQAVAWFYTIFPSLLDGSLHGYASDHELMKRLTPKFQQFDGPMPRTILDLRQRSLHNPVFSLRDLLALTTFVSAHEAERKIDATDDRDRIYALLGVATDEAARQIVPDYTISCHDTYVNTAHVLLEHGHYDILSLCRAPKRKHNLPSWTPDWSTPLVEPWSMDGFNPDRDYSACGHLIKQAIRRNATSANISRQINLDSITVDTIDRVGAPYATESDAWVVPGPGLRQYICDLNDYLAQSEKYSAEQKKEAEWRIPIADMEYDALNKRHVRPSALSRMQTGYACATAIKGWSKDVKVGSLSFQWLSLYPDAFTNGSPYGCYIVQLENMRGTRPFSSKQGYVGLCPEETAAGDMIVIFAGAKVPYIVRSNPDGSTWELVGEVYVHGIMDGEYVSVDSQTEVLTLQ